MYQRIEAIGRLGADPETRYTQNGDPVTNFSVAASEKWKDKQGQQQERTEWIKCTAFGRLAEVCGEYLKKGSLVFIAGKLQTNKWEKDGQTRYATGVVVSEMKMLESKSDAAPKKPAQDQAPFDDEIPF